MHSMPHMPNDADAHNRLGTALAVQGKLDEAAASFRQALSLKPDFAPAHNNLGLVCKMKGQLAEAVACYERALSFKPDYVDAHMNLGAARYEQNKLDEAAASFQQILRFRPDSAQALNNLGGILMKQGKLAEAAACCERALSLKPDYAEAHNTLGTVRAAQGKLDEAAASFRQALSLKPDFADALNNLCGIHLRIAQKDQGTLDEAIASYRQVLRLKPNYAAAHSNLIFILHYHPGYDSTALYQEARQWNTQHAEPLAKFTSGLRLDARHANRPDPERRLRLGYVSPDFRTHAMAHLLMPVLSNHDHRQVEIFCYAEVPCPDDVTQRLRAHADAWRSTVGLTDEQVADLVRQDRIDILVDLALHTANNRLLVFARKPAPVQVAWLGFSGTTGLSTIDYRLTDPYFDPPGEDDSCYAEQSIHLPDTLWAYDPLTDELAINELPALTNGWITFGCLNRLCKVNDGVLQLWAKVLHTVPRSRLLLLAPGREGEAPAEPGGVRDHNCGGSSAGASPSQPTGQARDHVLALLKQLGIDEPRVEFADRVPRQQYLQLYNRVDVALDVWPYNSHVTSFDAFWMGVPTMTLIGQTMAGRAGWCQLCNLGLQELAARTPEEFVAIAVQLAGDLPRLQELRQSLRSRMLRSPLMDGPSLARNVERAYRQMWQTWCRAASET